MHLLDTRGSDRRGLDGGGLRTRGGFVHVPFLPEQSARNGNAPNMALEDIVRALRIVVEVSLSQGSDLRLAGGATH